MRADLNKLLCERERVGHTRSYKDVRHNKKFKSDPDGELPSRESMKHRHARGASDTKSFNENLNPLWGQVRKAVGRPWNKFYGELCQNFDKRSVINQHILQHLMQSVETQAYYKDGELYTRNNYSGDIRLKDDTSTEYYVDPKDGILKKNKNYKRYSQINREHRKRREAEEEAVTRWLDDDNVLRKVGDVWFHFTLKDIPKGEVVFVKPEGKDLFDTGYGRRPHQMRSWDQLTDYEQRRHGVRTFKGQSVTDVFTGESLMFDRRMGRVYTSAQNQWYSGKKRYHATKRTASHKQLKQAGAI